MPFHMKVKLEIEYGETKHDKEDNIQIISLELLAKMLSTIKKSNLCAKLEVTQRRTNKDELLS